MPASFQVALPIERINVRHEASDAHKAATKVIVTIPKTTKCKNVFDSVYRVVT